MRQTALATIYEMAKTDPRIVFVGSDLGVGVLDNFKREMPDRFFMEGISEQHIVGMSAGLAMEGFIPYTSTIATFLSRRCYEQVVLDLCLHNQKVRLLSTGGGLVYAPLGPTHLAIEDISLMRVLPNMAVIVPADAVEMKKAILATVDYPGPIYIRGAKGGEPVVTPPDAPFILGAPVSYARGEGTVIVTTGITLQLALGAHKTLKEMGKHTSIVHVPSIAPLDAREFLTLLAGHTKIVTVEEHLRDGGLGSLTCELLAESGKSEPYLIKRIGIPREFPHEYGNQASLMTACGISEEAILSAVMS